MGRKAALLWDESFLWAIMAQRALEAAGLPFDIIRSEDVRRGCLADYRLLFVPGGWSSNKIKSLQESGASAIKDFVQGGGSYLGFCGGAGLATLDGIGLLNVRRKPTRFRVPSFSGPIRVATAGGLLRQGVGDPVFHAWWPPQIECMDESVSILATYREALPEAFSSDLNVGDLEAAGSWSGLEEGYGINLDPARLFGEPAVVEGRYGRGRVILSLLHFDTPDDPAGRQVLINVWADLGGGDTAPDAAAQHNPGAGQIALSSQHSAEVARIAEPAAALIDLGLRNFLWYWRNAMLLQWRRGVRGLEYCTLYGMVREIELRAAGSGDKSSFFATSDFDALAGKLGYFSGQAARLLLLERFALQSGPITYEQADDPEIRKIRQELFSTSKSYGGLFKEIVDGLDALLYGLIKKGPGNAPGPS